MAHQLKITGQATIEVFIDESGKVEQCDPVVGNPVLMSAAMKAVKSWTFKPLRAEGKPSKGSYPPDVRFPVVRRRVVRRRGPVVGCRLPRGKGWPAVMVAGRGELAGCSGGAKRL
jgi:TonB family protein